MNDGTRSRYGLLTYRGGPNRVAAALLELVELKDMIDAVEADFISETPALTSQQRNEQRADYKRRKPLAWDEARAALIEFFAASENVLLEGAAAIIKHAREAAHKMRSNNSNPPHAEVDGLMRIEGEMAEWLRQSGAGAGFCFPEHTKALEPFHPKDEHADER